MNWESSTKYLNLIAYYLGWCQPIEVELTTFYLLATKLNPQHTIAF